MSVFRGSPAFKITLGSPSHSAHVGIWKYGAYKKWPYSPSILSMLFLISHIVQNYSFVKTLVKECIFIFKLQIFLVVCHMSVSAF